MTNSEAIQDHTANEAGNLSQYQQRDDGTFRLSYSKKGEPVWIQIANFTAWIEEEHTHDDGLETELFFVIAGKGAEPFERITIPAKQFQTMNWLSGWGSSAIVSPGQNAKDHLRAAIQYFSKKVVKRRVITHTGWYKNGDGQYAYIHIAGAIGSLSEDTTSDLPNALADYKLPDPPTGEILCKAIRASLRLLDIAPPYMTYPVLAAVFAAPLGELLPNDYAVWVYGETGSRKSTVAALLLSHFGPFTRSTLPANFLSTANATELLSFHAKDTLLVFDDFAPRDDPSGKIAQESTAIRLLRGIGDNHARGRATSTGNLRNAKPARCLPLVTAELPPPGTQSSAARTLLVQWDGNSVLMDRVTSSQEEVGEYSKTMAGYLEWIAGRMNADFEASKLQVNNAFIKFRERLTARPGFRNAHGRIIETTAKLLAGISLVVTFALEKNAITKTEGSDYLSSAEAALALCAKNTDLLQREEKPTTAFIATLQTLFMQKHVYLEPKGDKSNGDDLLEWGWILRALGEVERRPNADMIGWYDTTERTVCLVPDAAYNAVCGFIRKQGRSFPVTRRALGDALEREGLLTYTEQGRKTRRIRVGNNQTHVWAIRADDFLDCNSEEVS